MNMIQVDEQTAKLLELAAANAGLSVADYVKVLVAQKPTTDQSVSWETLEREIIDLSVDGSLPEGFSRAEIYFDHD